MQRGDDALLVGGGQPREQGGLLHHRRQLRVAHGLDLRAQQDVFGGDADLVADLLAHQLIVAGEHLDRDAVLAQGHHRGRRGVFGGIEEGHIAAQDQFAFVGLGVGGLAIQVAVGNRQHTKAVAGQTPVLFLQILDEHPLHGHNLALVFEVRAALEQLLGRALADETRLPGRRFHHD